MRLYEISGGGTIFVMYAYSNPPTKEYKHYFNSIKDKARLSSSDYIIYLNPITQKEVNPLPFIDIMKYTKLIYPMFTFSNDKKNNTVDIMKDLSKKYSNIVFMVTEDEKETYNNLQVYAEELGFVTFDVIVFDKAVEYNKEARESVNDNDFVKFKECFDSNNQSLLSQLFITMRKIMNLSEHRQIDNTMPFYREIVDDNIKIDKLGNRYIEFNNRRITEVSSIDKPTIGLADNKKTLFINKLTLENCIDHIGLFESTVGTTVASNVASTSSIIGEPISRSMVNIKDIIENNSTLEDAMRYSVNTYNMITSDIIKELRKHYD